MASDGEAHAARDAAQKALSIMGESVQPPEMDNSEVKSKTDCHRKVEKPMLVAPAPFEASQADADEGLEEEAEEAAQEEAPEPVQPEAAPAEEQVQVGVTRNGAAVARARARAAQRARGPSAAFAAAAAAAKSEAPGSPAPSPAKGRKRRASPRLTPHAGEPAPSLARRRSLRGAGEGHMELQLGGDATPVRYAQRVKRARLANQARGVNRSPAILGVQVAPTPTDA